MEKVSNLNELILNLRQRLKKKNVDFDQLEYYKDKISNLNSSLSEMKQRLKSCEENSERKDRLAEGMKKSLEMVKGSIKEAEERNTTHLQERELLKGALNHVSFQGNNEVHSCVK